MPWPIPDLRTTLCRAFGHWLIVHGDALYRYALLRLRDEHKAEEAVQETLLAALQARARIAGGASVRTWLIGSLKHKILDQFRREAREIALDDPDGRAEMDDIVERSFADDGHWATRIADWGDPTRNRPYRTGNSGQFWTLPGTHARAARQSVSDA